MGTLTGDEVRQLCNPVESIEPMVHPNLHTKSVAWYSLPTDRVRYVGEPVVGLVASSPYTILDALEAFDVEYDPLPAVTNAEVGLSKETPLLYDHWKDNVLMRFHFDGGDVDGALKKSDVIVETKIRMHRHTASPIENRAYLADYDRRRSFLTLYSTSQSPHVTRTYLSSILKMPENSIRVIAPDVGGAFGRGHPTYSEEIVVCLLSMRLGVPVKWVGTRRECLMTDHHSREQAHEVRAGFKKDGTLLAVEDRICVDMGVFQPTGGIASSLVTSKLVPGPYKLRNYRVEITGVTTNKSPFGANRGFGKESAALVHERLMDIAAEKLGIDPAEIRLRNFVQPQEFPYTSVIGERYDSGDYPESLNRVLNAIEYAQVRKKQNELRRLNRHLGIGIAVGLCPGSLSNPDNLYTGWDSAMIVMDPSGYVTVLAGVASPGTEHAITLAQVAADELGLPLESVRVVEGDTLVCPYGSGNWSDRGATIGASAVLLAARKLKEKLAKIAAHLLGVSPDAVEFREGKVVVQGETNRSISLSEVAWAAHASPNKLPGGMEPGLTVTASFSFPPSEVEKDGKWGMYNVYSSQAVAAVVEVDPETFQTNVLRYVMADDSGVLINPKVVEGQLIGAAAQGISATILEELVYDRDGQLTTSTLMDYLVATARETPAMEVEHVIVPSPMTPLGTKGAGETGIVGPYAALCSAVEDALRPLKIRITGTPISQEVLWKLTRTSSP
jgi:carbon-monoxide dehydrogenase large subunit